MEWLYVERLKKPQSETKALPMSAIKQTRILKHQLAVGDYLFFQYSTVPRLLKLTILDSRIVPYRFSDDQNLDGAVNIDGYEMSTLELINKYFGQCEKEIVKTPFCGSNFSVWRVGM